MGRSLVTPIGEINITYLSRPNDDLGQAERRRILNLGKERRYDKMTSKEIQDYFTDCEKTARFRE